MCVRKHATFYQLTFIPDEADCHMNSGISGAGQWTTLQTLVNENPDLQACANVFRSQIRPDRLFRTLGTKGLSFLKCDPLHTFHCDNMT